MRPYPVQLVADDNGTLLATFPDLPGAMTFGADRDEAMARARDALLAWLSAMLDDGEAVPPPSPLRGRPGVSLPTTAAMKLALHAGMRAAGLRKLDLAKRLALPLQRIDRLLDLGRASPVEEIEAALATVGKKLTVSVEDAAA